MSYGQEFVTFGANGQRSNVLQQVWKNGTWVNYTQDNYTYDANGHQTLDVGQNWSSGAWVNYIQWTSTYDTDGNKSDDVEQDWYKNAWRNSEWMHYTWMLAGAIAVVAPVQGETILAGSFYEIQWHAPGSNAVNIKLSLDSARTFHTIAYNIPAENTYAWQVPETLSAKCRIRICDVEDSTKNGESGQFRIKPYVLTRFKPNGDYERFDPKIHGWQFDNSSETMWPRSWWIRFDYREGIDPITGREYSSAFIDAPASTYPDWPLFVRAFGVGSCYYYSAPYMFNSLRAVHYWDHIRTPFDGACFGFTVSSLINFDYPTLFKANYPQLGDFSQLYDLRISDSTQLVVNLHFTYQSGATCQQYRRAAMHNTPRETLQELKQMFLSDVRTDQALGIFNVGGNMHGHSIVPYALAEDPATGTVKVLVYDPDCPGGDCGNGITGPAVTIDSVNNVWYYPRKQWPKDRSATRGVYLDPPVNMLLNNPRFMPKASSLASTPVHSPFDAGSASVLVFSTPDAAINITDAAFDTIGFHDSTVVNTFPDGMPIIPETGESDGPLGYLIPAGSYGIRMSSFQDTLVRIDVFDTVHVFSYRRTDAQAGQSDNLSCGNGFDVGNPDPQAKKISLGAVLTLAASERSVEISNCSLVKSDSLRMSAPDSGQLKLVNLGSQKTYDLNVVTGGPAIAGTYSHTSVTLPAHSTHYILPHWPDLHQPLRIMEHVGNKGAISDTLTLADQTTGGTRPAGSGIPSVFALEQNYPNPFNPSTTIKYELPRASQVSLTVYDILGRQVSVLVNDRRDAGVYEVKFDGSNLASGVYFYRIQAGSFVQTKKLLLIK